METNDGSEDGKSLAAGSRRRNVTNMMRYLSAFPGDPHFRLIDSIFGNEVDGAALAAEPMEWTGNENVPEEISDSELSVNPEPETLSSEEVFIDADDEDGVAQQMISEELTEHLEAENNHENDVAIGNKSKDEERIIQERNDNEETVVKQTVQSDEEGEEFGADDRREYLPFLKPDARLAFPAFSKPHITVQDHLIAVIAASVRYNMTYENTLTMLRWINSTLVDKGLPTTKNALWTAFNRDSSYIKRHWYCGICGGKIGVDDEGLTQCPCGKSVVNSNRRCFLQLSLRAQLHQLLSIPNIAQELKYSYTRSKENEDALEDVYDAKEYKKLCLIAQFLFNKWNFSFTINTDGCSVSNSSHVSAWPVYVEINELSPHARKKHMLLAGVWVDRGHPAANVFLGPIVNELVDLYSNGITWKPDGEIEVVSKFVTLICTVDSIARPLILRMNQFNGDYGCTLCYTEGHREVGKPGCKTYPVDKNCSLRTDEQLRVHMTQASDGDNKVFGVQGTSCLSALPDFDLCKGMVVDSMHNVYLGVTKQHTELLLHDTHSPWYVGTPTQLKIIDERLSSIKAPSRISRRPRSIAAYHRQWKASEWRNWLLYYSLPCLEGVLPSCYLEHLSLLVQAIHTLNKNSITAEELSESRQRLIEYVQRFQDFFGVERMTFNVHLLTHLSDTVSNWGPLWVTSTFPFESWNHRILKTVTSPNGRVDQIVTRFLMAKFVDNIIHDDTVSVETRSFVAKLMHSIDYKDNEARLSRSFMGLGKSKTEVPSDEKVLALARKGYECARVTLFTKATVNGVEYRCSAISDTTLFCNSMVFTQSIGFAKVVDIVQFGYEGRRINGMFLHPYKSLGDAFGTNCLKKVTLSKSTVFVEVSDIRGPALAIKTPENLYMVRLANCWESD